MDRGWVSSAQWDSLKDDINQELTRYGFSIRNLIQLPSGKYQFNLSREINDDEKAKLHEALRKYLGQRVEP